MRVLLVYPRNPDTFWSFKHSLPFVSKKCSFQPLGLLTIAAMMPREWALRLVDLNVEQLRDDDILQADYVMITGMIVHKASIREVVARCRRLGKPLIAGGPVFTTGIECFPEVQHFVLGEAEDVMPALIADMERGTVKPVYQAPDRPDIRSVPVPRWDLVDMRNYVTMSVQFSRGCPYDCEFCDIIEMNGRVPRTKTPEQLIRELDALRAHGWNEMVFIVDDNFIGNKKCAKALLRALIDWRQRTQPQMGFLTEASVNLAEDREMCDLMVQAGFKKVFLGIETPSLESLEECHKLQNTRRDLVESVQTIQRAGMEVMAGFIVGFDSDRDDIFRRQFEFIQRSGVVTAMVGLLTALPQTALYRRLLREGRIEAESTGNSVNAVLNFKTILDRQFLVDGYRDLMNRLYEPKFYYRRIRTFLANHRPQGPKLRTSVRDVKAFLKSIWLLGVRHRGQLSYWRCFVGTLVRRPRQLPVAIELAIVGHHFRRVANGL
jgi:radical SAM superfamily enzyme YgiQ (UPF0313 family)